MCPTMNYMPEIFPFYPPYLLRTEITKSHLNNHICQHRGMKTSTVTPSFYYVFNISLYCNGTIPSFIGNLWRVLLLRYHLNSCIFEFATACQKVKILRMRRNIRVLSVAKEVACVAWRFIRSAHARRLVPATSRWDKSHSVNRLFLLQNLVAKDKR